jgi:hypothetical protein
MPVLVNRGQQAKSRKEDGESNHTQDQQGHPSSLRFHRGNVIVRVISRKKRRIALEMYPTGFHLQALWHSYSLHSYIILDVYSIVALSHFDLQKSATNDTWFPYS